MKKYLLFILSLLGFASACSDGGGGVKYGAPSADFILNGSVKSATDNHVLPDISISMEGAIDTTATNGTYQLQITAFPDPQNFTVTFRDTDTLHNGHFKDSVTTVTFPAMNFTGGTDEWYKGQETVTLDMKLKAK